MEKTCQGAVPWRCRGASREITPASGTWTGFVR